MHYLQRNLKNAKPQISSAKEEAEQLKNAPKPKTHMAKHPLYTSENSENNGVYHLFLYLDTAKGETGGFHVNTPLKSIKTTYESYDFSVFGRTKKRKKKEKSSKAVYESAQCMLPTHWDL